MLSLSLEGVRGCGGSALASRGEMRGQPPGPGPHPAGLVLTFSKAPTVCRPVEGTDAEPRETPCPLGPRGAQEADLGGSLRGLGSQAACSKLWDLLTVRVFPCVSLTFGLILLHEAETRLDVRLHCGALPLALLPARAAAGRVGSGNRVSDF